MNTNKIDDIIIKGLQESERRNEYFAEKAKSRVWDAIDIPKRGRTVNWWMVSAMAAAISFFLVSTILFLKLESQKKELLALQSFVSNEISQKESTYEIGLPEPEEIIEKRPTIIEETALNVKSEKANSQGMNLKRDVDEGKKVIEPIISKPNLAMMTITKPEIDLPQIFQPELSQEVVQISELTEETFTEPKSKKQGKLKFKIGNGIKTHDYQNTYALNIKI